MKHMIEKNLFNKGQHGFVPGRSTQTQLLMHLETIYGNMVNGNSTDVIYLDFAKAFDKVDHNILYEKVKKHKITGKLGKWIKEFLHNRKQVVIANGVQSKEVNVKSGVPQGTVLAAILFVMMISDIDEDIMESMIRSFADDTRISRAIKTNEDKEKLQEDLNKIYEWARKNLMVFNSNKFEHINYGNKEDIHIYKGPNNEEITTKEKIKDLGVILNSEMTCEDNIAGVVSKCRSKMGMIFRFFKTRKLEHMKVLYKTYIRSILEYCNIVCYPHYQKDIAKLESIQRAFTARIEGMENLDYWERLKKMKMYSLERRRERYMIILAWLQIENKVENILNLEVSKRNTRGRIIVPKTIPGGIRKACRTTIHNAPAATMQRLYNVLPAYLRDITGVNVETYKKHLDRYLADIPDHPRLDDAKYTGRCLSNSLLDVRGTST